VPEFFKKMLIKRMIVTETENEGILNPNKPPTKQVLRALGFELVSAALSGGPGSSYLEPCDSESEILRWVKNRALVARRRWEEGSTSSVVVGERPWGPGGEAA
jgi:hypothetical protein